MDENRTKQHLHSVSEAISRTAEWIKVTLPRDDRNLALFNLLIALPPFLEVYTYNLTGPIAVLALCTRSAFELNLRARFVIEKEGLNIWLTEAADEWVEILDSVIGLAEPGDPRIPILEDERSRITKLKPKHKLSASRKHIKDLTIARLAADFHLNQEYKSLYKLFSKIVHPTSCAVNGLTLLDRTDIQDVLLKELQIYALECMKRIGDALGVPADVMAPGTSSGSNYR